MSSVFISYRRDDSKGFAGRLYDDLVERIGSDRVFRDVDTIAPGRDFVEVLNETLDSVRVLIVVIGPKWSIVTDSNGRRRLDDPNDFVRMEIGRALSRDVMVVPVLVEDAKMPRVTELPEDLQPLCRRQYQELSDSRWDYDFGNLVKAIEEGPSGIGRTHRRAFIAAGAGGALLIGAPVLGWRFWQDDSQSDLPDLSTSFPELSTWSVYQPLNEQLEVLTIDPLGQLTVRWKTSDEIWNAPVAISGPGLAPAGAPVATAFYPPNNQMDTFVVGLDGAVYVIWKAQNEDWNSPVALTAGGFAPPGSPISAIYYPQNEQVELFVVDNAGAVDVVWKAHNGAWNAPLALTAAGFAPQGASLAAVYYPLNEQLVVFVIDNAGSVNVLWKVQNSAWNFPQVLTAAGFAPLNGGLSATYYPPNNQLEVFLIDNAGSAYVLWKVQNGAWNVPLGISSAGIAPGGSRIASVYNPHNEQLEVYFIDGSGALNLLWKVDNSDWFPPVSISNLGFAIPGAQVAVTYYSPSTQIEVFTADEVGEVQLVWKDPDNNWSDPVSLG